MKVQVQPSDLPSTRRLLENHCTSHDQLCAYNTTQQRNVVRAQVSQQFLLSWQHNHQRWKEETVLKKAEAYRMFLCSILGLEH